MPNFWDQFKAKSYEDLNKNLGGLPSLIASRVDPTGYQQRKAERDAIIQQSAKEQYDREMAAQGGAIQEQNKQVAGPVGTAVSGATGYAKGLMPIAGQTVRVPHGYLNELAKRAGVEAPVVDPEQAHPEASAIGGAAGAITGALAQPAAGNVIAGAVPRLAGRKLVPMLVRNALTAVQGAVPGAVADISSGAKSAGETGKEFLKSVALGTGVGTAAEGIIGKLPAILSKLKKATTGAAVREVLGVDTRSLRNAATIGGAVKSPGAVRGRAKDIEEDLVDLINKKGVVDEPTTEAWLAGQKAKWQGVDQAFDASGQKVSDFESQIRSDPTVAAYLQEHGAEGEKRLNSLIQKSDQKAGIGDIRQFLQKQINFLFKNPRDLIDQDTAEVAKVIRNTIDGAFVPPELKADYAKYKALDNALTREDLKLNRPLSVGSQTAGRMLGGATMGAATAGFDPNDPEAWKQRLIRGSLGAAAGMAAGSLGQRAGVALGNKLTGRLAAKIAPLIPTFERVGQNAGKVANVVARLQEQSSKQAEPELQPQTPTEAKTQANIQATEEQATPEHVEAAKQATNSAWEDTVRERLGSMYDTYLSQYGDLLSKEEFFKQADAATNHFDPRMTAGFVFTNQDEKENYLKSYEAALRLQDIKKQYGGKDFINEALTKGNILGIPSSIGVKGVDERIAYNQLRDWAASLMTERGKAPAKATIDQVSKDLDTIINMRIPQERKRQLLMDHLANYGLDVSKLVGYGQLGEVA